jgi:hypothetical protein
MMRVVKAPDVIANLANFVEFPLPISKYNFGLRLKAKYIRAVASKVLNQMLFQYGRLVDDWS